MFDNITCEYPLPLEGANALTFQTKDTPSQFLDNYKIEEDGTLWYEDYDVEDQSEAGKWLKEHPSEEPSQPFGIMDYGGCITRINQRWEPCNLTGEIRFYTSSFGKHDRIEFSAYFDEGKLKFLKQIAPNAD